MGLKPAVLISAILHVLAASVVVVSGGSGNVQEKGHIMVSLVKEPAEKKAAQRTLGADMESAGQALVPVIKPSERPEAAQINVPEEKRDVQPETDAGTGHSQDRQKTVAVSIPKTVDTFKGIGIREVPRTPVRKAAYGTNTGSSEDAKTSEQNNDLLKLYAIRAAIEKEKKYPLLARKKGIEGTVRIGFRISRGGEPEDIRIIKGSGSGILDNATLAIVKRAGPFPDLSGPVEVPVVYRLTD